MATTSYQSALRRIKAADTAEKLRKVEDGLARVYDAGHLTAPELDRLYTLTFEKLAEVQPCPCA